MGKDKSRGLLASMAQFLTCSFQADADEDIPVALYHELDHQTLRDFEDSVIGKTGLLHLTGSKLRKYEARLRELEKVFLRTAYIPLDSPSPSEEDIPLQAQSVPPQDVDRLLPAAQWRADAGEEASTASEGLENGRQRDGTSHRITRQGSLGDLKFVPAVGLGENGRGLNRLWTTESRWSCPRPGQLTRRRSLGDLREIGCLDPQLTAGGLNRLKTSFSMWSRPERLVVPQDTNGGLNRLETTLSTWSRPQRLTRSQSLVDMREAPAVSLQTAEDRLNRLETTLFAWSLPRRLTRSQSLGDMREAPVVSPQTTGDRLNHLETTLSTWSRPPQLARSRSFGDVREAPTVSPQTVGDNVNRLETSFSPWSRPRIERKLSGEGASMRVIPAVTPQHLADRLNRLETSVWVWCSPTPKTGSQRVTRTRKLLKLKSPAPLRYRHADGKFRGQPSPLWVSSSDFDSEAAQAWSGDHASSSSPGDKAHRHKRQNWSLEGIVECSLDELGQHLAEQNMCGGTDSGMDECGSQSASDLSHSRVSETERARSTLLSARRVYVTSEKGGAHWDEDGVTRLVSKEPGSKFIIKEKKSPA